MSRPQPATRMALRYARRGVRGATHLAVPAKSGDRGITFEVMVAVCGDALKGRTLTHEIISPSAARRFWRANVCEECDRLAARQRTEDQIKRVACW